MGLSKYEELNQQCINLIKDGRWEDAYENIKSLADQGNKDAIATLAHFYLYGVGIVKDFDYGINLIDKAIELGSSDAALELGELYYDNKIGFPTNSTLAFEYFEKCAHLGGEGSYWQLARCYLYGVGTDTNEEKAFDYSMKSAKAGDPNGFLYAAMCYEDGIGTAQDPFAACHFYKEILNYEPEDDFVMLRIAICLADPYGRFGFNATEDMLNEAFHFASKSLELGNVEAHLIIGWFYEKGDIVPQDFNMAYKYIKIAAENGNEVAKNHLQDFRKNIFGNYYIPGY